MVPLVAHPKTADQPQHGGRSARLRAVKRSSWFVIAAVVACLGAAAWFLFVPRETLPQDLMQVVPADSYGAVRIHVDRVLASDAFKRLVVERGEAKGMERVTKTCGFNPLERLKEVVVFARPAPNSMERPHLAFVARGNLPHSELLRCVEKVTGTDRSKLRTEEIEGITTVASSKGSSRAAFVGRDGVIGGDAESVRAVIQALHKQAPNLLGDNLLRELFQQVEGGQDIAGVVRIPDELRPQLRMLAGRLMGGILAPLAEVRAVAGNLSLSDSKLAGGTTLLTTDAAQATAVVGLARGQIDRVMRIPGVGLTPAGGVLRGIQTEARGDRATFTGAIKVSTVEALLELLPALAKLRESLEAPAEPAPTQPADPTQAAEPAKPTAPSPKP